MWKIHLQAMKISGLDFSCCSPSMMQWRRFRHSESTNNNNNVFFFVLICLCCDYLFFMSFWRFWTPHHQEEYCDFVQKCFSFTVTKYYEMSCCCCCWLFIFFSSNIIKFDFRAAAAAASKRIFCSIAAGILERGWEGHLYLSCVEKWEIIVSSDLVLTAHIVLV